jgi:dimethylargininase
MTAITRAVSPTLASCELTWLPRQEIDIAKAISQHHNYERCLRDLGLRVISLPALPDHPDAVFVEDPAIVLDEIAIITPMGCESRRGERQSLAEALAAYRPVRWLRDGTKIEGGDVMRIGRDLFVGLSARTDQAGIAQLSIASEPFGYRVIPIDLTNCLHLKSACTYIGDDAILINRAWVDTAPFHAFRLIDVPPEEPGAANALRIAGTVLMPDAFPATAELLRNAGFEVCAIDLSELLKAESGVTCSSLIFD